MTRLLSIAAVLFGSAACVSHASRIGATPIESGASATGVGLNVLSFERGRRRAVTVSPDVSHRRPILRDCDLGGRFALVHGELDARCLVASSGDASLALAPTIAIGMQPATNNTTDLLYARFAGRLIAEVRTGERVGWILTLQPAVVATGPATIFRGVARASEWRKGRVLFQPGAALGVVLSRERGPDIHLEVGMAPSIPSRGEAPALQVHGGVGLLW